MFHVKHFVGIFMNGTLDIKIKVSLEESTEMGKKWQED